MLAMANKRMMEFEEAGAGQDYTESEEEQEEVEEEEVEEEEVEKPLDPTPVPPSTTLRGGATPPTADDTAFVTATVASLSIATASQWGQSRYEFASKSY